MIGACSSCTVTVKEQVDVFPQASVATDWTVVVPFWKTLPDGGVDTTATLAAANLGCNGPIWTKITGRPGQRRLG